MYSEDDLITALHTLRQGGVILYPTDTIWGIGCDALNDEAVRRIYQIKQRDDSKALILLLDGQESLQRYVILSPAQSDALQSHVHVADSSLQERPTTVIYPSVHGLPSSLKAADGSVGIRLTNEPFTKALCRALGHPLVSTSANRSGMPSPDHFGEMDPTLLHEVDYVCRYRQDDTTPASPSRIVRLMPDGQVTILRS